MKFFQRYFILGVCVVSACRQSKEVTIINSEEKYANGKLKWHMEVKSLKSRKFQLYESSQRKITTWQGYYSNGNVYMTWKLVEDTGAENACRETFYEVTEYHYNGTKARHYRMECDCHKQWEKTWNDKGKLLTKNKAVIKRLY